MRRLCSIVCSVFATTAWSACDAGGPSGYNCDGVLHIDLDAGAMTPAVAFSPAGQPEARVFVALESTNNDKNCATVNVTLPADEGVFFNMGRNYRWPVNNDGTPFAAEFIFIDQERVVVDIIGNLPPNDKTWRKASDNFHYLMQLNAGWSSTHGVVIGTPATFENISL